MIQEISQNDKSTALSDLLLVGALILAIVFARAISDFARSLPFGGAVQLLIIVALIAICYLVYKKRLCSYRYTFFFKEPEGEEDAFGEPLKNPYPLGTLVIERMVADKGKLYELIAPGELRALVAPGEPLPQRAEGVKKLKRLSLTVKPASSAHTLITMRDGVEYQIRFHPTALLVEKLNEAIDAVNG